MSKDEKKETNTKDESRENMLTELTKDLNRAKMSLQQLSRQSLMLQGTISYLQQKVNELQGGG